MGKPTMKVTGIAPWFGGKRSMAEDIVQEMGPHRAFCDVFCGSMPIVLVKPRSPQEICNDLHGDLVNLAMVLASDKHEMLQEKLLRTLCSDVLFQDVRQEWMESAFVPPASRREVADVHVQRAWCFFVVSWMGRNGVAGTARANYQMAIRFTPGGGSGGRRFRSAVESVQAWHDRLREVTILNRDAFDLVPRIDDADGVVVYADPPYIRSTRGDGGGSAYQYDFDDSRSGQETTNSLFAKHEDKHAILAEQLRRFKRARVVVSYYEHPRLRELYEGWTFRPMYRQKHLHVQNRRGEGPCEAPEVLIINGPSYAKESACTSKS